MLVLSLLTALPVFHETPVMVIQIHLQSPEPRVVRVITPSETLSFHLQKDTTLLFHPSAGWGNRTFPVTLLSKGIQITRTYRWQEVPPFQVRPGIRSLHVQSPWPGLYRIELYDAIGRRVRALTPRLDADRPLTLFRLSPGVYFFKVSRDNIVWKGKGVVF